MSAQAIYRIDRFNVPARALPAFMERVRQTQRTLDELPGCRQNLVLTQPDLAGEFNVMTVVEWSDETHLAAAKALIQQRYAEERFDPAAFMQGLGVKADLGLYRHA
ncbi:antibiotic biosynthesis monooxygenase [Dyella amyloliquefaciens]|uniref:antibiotic biosynthesis monooxygenase n=1 Tax=Dyella amyloliquefaciens TaxID=1770545 RepID=UPI00102EBE00|nr:antibiotic biosynthesis monooxygenase [Dyella amyloliquefaciens]